MTEERAVNGGHYLGRPHISQLGLVGWLRKVQCLQVHRGAGPPEAPPIGGSGEALGPTYEVCRELGGDGTATYRE